MNVQQECILRDLYPQKQQSVSLHKTINWVEMKMMISLCMNPLLLISIKQGRQFIASLLSHNLHFFKGTRLQFLQNHPQIRSAMQPIHQS